MSGVKKIAMIVSIIGREKSLPILTKMPRSVVEEIDKEVKAIGTIVKPEALSIMKEYNKISNIIVAGKNEGSLLDSYDDAKLSESPIEARKRKWIGFTKLSELPTEKILNLIKGESPLHQVVILNNMPDKVGKEVFSLMSKDEKVLFTIESSSSLTTDNETISIINDVIESKVDSLHEASKTNLDSALIYTSSMSDDDLEELLEALPEDLAQKIRDEVITFTNIISQSKETLTKILGTIDAQTLAHACANAKESEIEHIKECITTTKSEDFDYNISEMNRDDKKIINDAQAKIIIRAKEMNSADEIEIIK